MILLPVLLLGALGLAVGSFLNVVIWRLPQGLSVVSPASACPRCGAPIRFRDNVPVASWLVLRGRCRGCSAPISARYPLVEATTCVLFAGAGWWVLAGGESPWLLPALLHLAAISIALTMIDLDTGRLPNAIVLPAYPVTAVLLLVASMGEGAWGNLPRAAAGGAALFVFYFVLAFARPGGMGFGDVKLAGIVGMHLGWVGWGAVVTGAFSAFLLGGLFSIVLMILGRAGRKSGIPFGPWIVLGAWTGLVVGEELWQWYLTSMF